MYSISNGTILELKVEDKISDTLNGFDLKESAKQNLIYEKGAFKQLAKIKVHIYSSKNCTELLNCKS